MALQNFNVLSGVEPDMPRRIADSITEPSTLPQPVDLERALGEHPDYLIASRRIEYERYGVKLASARFMPRLSAGVQGVWNSLSPNFSGETEVDGLTFLRLSIRFSIGGSVVGRWRCRRPLSARPSMPSDRRSTT